MQEDDRACRAVGDGPDGIRRREYRFGSREALDLLLAYNQEDVLNMQDLLTFAFNGLRGQIMAL